MALFDDPGRELNRLNRRLLAEEEPEEEYEEEFELEEEIDDLDAFGLDIRDFSNGYRGQALMDEDFEEDWDGNDDEPYAVFYESRRERRKRIRQEKKERRKKRNSTLRLKVIVLLETLILFGILIWWVMNQWPL